MIKTDFLENPGEGTRYIVRKYTKELIEAIFKNIGEFALKPHLQEKNLC